MTSYQSPHPPFGGAGGGGDDPNWWSGKPLPPDKSADIFSDLSEEPSDDDYGSESDAGEDPHAPSGSGQGAGNKKRKASEAGVEEEVKGKRYKRTKHLVETETPRLPNESEEAYQSRVRKNRNVAAQKLYHKRVKEGKQSQYTRRGIRAITYLPPDLERRPDESEEGYADRRRWFLFEWRKAYGRHNRQAGQGRYDSPNAPSYEQRTAAEFDNLQRLYENMSSGLPPGREVPHPNWKDALFRKTWSLTDPTYNPILATPTQPTQIDRDCKRCKTLELPCDRAVPSCAACKQHNVECSDAKKGTGKKRGRPKKKQPKAKQCAMCTSRSIFCDGNSPCNNCVHAGCEAQCSNKPPPPSLGGHKAPPKKCTFCIQSQLVCDGNAPCGSCQRNYEVCSNNPQPPAGDLPPAKNTRARRVNTWYLANCDNCKADGKKCNRARPCGYCTSNGWQCVYAPRHKRCAQCRSNGKQCDLGRPCGACRTRQSSNKDLRGRMKEIGVECVYPPGVWEYIEAARRGENIKCPLNGNPPFQHANYNDGDFIMGNAGQDGDVEMGGVHNNQSIPPNPDINNLQAGYLGDDYLRNCLENYLHPGGLEHAQSPVYGDPFMGSRNDEELVAHRIKRLQELLAFATRNHPYQWADESQIPEAEWPDANEESCARCALDPLSRVCDADIACRECRSRGIVAAGWCRTNNACERCRIANVSCDDALPCTRCRFAGLTPTDCRPLTPYPEDWENENNLLLAIRTRTQEVDERLARRMAVQDAIDMTAAEIPCPLPHQETPLAFRTSEQTRHDMYCAKCELMVHTSGDMNRLCDGDTACRECRSRGIERHHCRAREGKSCLTCITLGKPCDEEVPCTRCFVYGKTASECRPEWKGYEAHATLKWDAHSIINGMRQIYDISDEEEYSGEVPDFTPPPEYTPIEYTQPEEEGPTEDWQAKDEIPNHPPPLPRPLSIYERDVENSLDDAARRRRRRIERFIKNTAKKQLEVHYAPGLTAQEEPDFIGDDDGGWTDCARCKLMHGHDRNCDPDTACWECRRRGISAEKCRTFHKCGSCQYYDLPCDADVPCTTCWVGGRTAEECRADSRPSRNWEDPEDREGILPRFRFPQRPRNPKLPPTPPPPSNSPSSKSKKGKQKAKRKKTSLNDVECNRCSRITGLTCDDKMPCTPCRKAGLKDTQCRISPKCGECANNNFDSCENLTPCINCDEQRKPAEMCRPDGGDPDYNQFLPAIPEMTLEEREDHTIDAFNQCDQLGSASLCQSANRSCKGKRAKGKVDKRVICMSEDHPDSFFVCGSCQKDSDLTAKEDLIFEIKDMAICSDCISDLFDQARNDEDGTAFVYKGGDCMCYKKVKNTNLCLPHRKDAVYTMARRHQDELKRCADEDDIYCPTCKEKNKSERPTGSTWWSCGACRQIICSEYTWEEINES
jgi:hypothetical protein